MAKVDERIERLLSRQLDGELSPDEELELNKELIRSPAARALMEEYEKNDLAARMVLRVTLAPGDVQPEFHPAEADRSGGTYRWWWGVASVAAIAAAVAVIVSAPSLFKAIEADRPESTVAETHDILPNPNTAMVAERLGTKPERLSPLVGPRPLRRTHVAERQIDRFLIPVIIEDGKADDGTLPIWEIQRRRVRVQRVSGDL